MSDMALFCYSCCAIGNLVKCCPHAPGSVALVPVGFANGVARTIGKLHARVAELESRLAEIEAQEPVAVVIADGVSVDVAWNSGKKCAAGTKLYTRPSAPQPVKEDTK